MATLCHTPYVCLTEADFLLQQGNDTKHSSKLYKNYFKKKQSQDILYNDVARILAGYPLMSCCENSVSGGQVGRVQQTFLEKVLHIISINS